MLPLLVATLVAASGVENAPAAAAPPVDLADIPGCRTEGPWSRGHFVLRPAVGFTSDRRGADDHLLAVLQVSGGLLLRVLRCRGEEPGSIHSYDVEPSLSYALTIRGSPRHTIGLGLSPSVDSVWATLGALADVLVARQAGETAFGFRFGVIMKAFAGIAIVQGGIEAFPEHGFANQFVVTVGTDIQLLASRFGPATY